MLAELPPLQLSVQAEHMALEVDGSLARADPVGGSV